MSEQRFWSKVEFDHESGCWLWVGSVNPKGYGQFYYDGGPVRVHRWSYAHFVGPIPDGLVIDHLCRVRHCVRPDHMEPVTQAENVGRGESGLHYPVKTHCLRGHPYDDANTYIYPSGRRSCRTCRKTLNATYRLHTKEQE